MLSNVGPTQLIIILLIVLLLFGAKKIPEIAKGLGRGIKDFKGALKEEDGEDVKKADPSIDKPRPAAENSENRENRPSA